MKYKNLMWVALGTALILSVPLIAMQFTNQVVWTGSDFIVMGGLLFFTFSLLDLAIRKTGKYRVFVGVLIVALFLWLWAELAVGIFTNWGS